MHWCDKQWIFQALLIEVFSIYICCGQFRVHSFPLVLQMHSFCNKFYHHTVSDTWFPGRRKHVHLANPEQVRPVVCSFVCIFIGWSGWTLGLRRLSRRYLSTIALCEIAQQEQKEPSSLQIWFGTRPSEEKNTSMMRMKRSGIWRVVENGHKSTLP